MISSDVAGPGALIQSSFRSGEYGNFEVVVPLRRGGDVELWHFFHDNSDVNLPWTPAHRIAGGVAGPGGLIQSSFRSGEHGNFEVVVPLRRGGDVELWHFFHDNSDVNLPWTPAHRIAGGVAGPGGLIQSSFRSGEHGNFEVVVPLAMGGGMVLWHFFHDNRDVSLPWQPVRPIVSGVTGPATLIQSDFRSTDHGNFELVVPVRGDFVHYWHDNSTIDSPWRRGQTIASCAGGWVALTSSDYRHAEHRNFELLAEELTQSLVAYWHPNEDVHLPWLRHEVLIGELYPPRLATTRKIVQLTGENDLEGWPGNGPKSLAFNRTETQAAQIRGCDLGASFGHKGRVYFLFGDTWHVRVTPENVNLDSVAYTTDSDPIDGVHLTFLTNAPIIDPPVNQREFCVPLDGTSHDGFMYVFFSTGHWKPGGIDQMGRSLLTRCTDEFANSFQQVAPLSDRYFINVSVEQGQLDDQTASLLGWEPKTPVLWLWGSGRYRMSDVRLAVVALSDIDGLTDVRYFSAEPGQPSLWTRNEEDALPVIRSGSVGELSVRWNPVLSRYIALFNSDNPGGILLHSSPTAWGPWSTRPLMVFDAWWGTGENHDQPGDGIGRFMHRSWAAIAPRRIDYVQDNIIPNGADPTKGWNTVPLRDNTDGGAYGPYQISTYTSGEGTDLRELYFTMSTWNPYQTVLMATAVSRADLQE